MRQFSIRALSLAGVFALALAAQLVAPRSAEAIPAWGRRYKVDCSSCHMGGGWKLTKMGQDFLRYGHQMEGDKAEGSLTDYTSLGYKFRFTGGEKGVIESFEEHAFSIYTGGPLGEGFSYFAEMYLHENSGKNTGASDFGDYGRTKLAETFLRYTVGGEKNFFAVRAGQLAPELLHINQVGARTSGGRPKLLTSRINGGNSYQLFSRQYGLDLTYHVSGFTGTVGLLNGTGATFNVVDNNQHKDVFASADYSFGEMGSHVGVFYYNGKAPISNAAGAFQYDDKYDRLALMADYTMDMVSFKGMYMMGKDDINVAGTDGKGKGFMAEVFVYPWTKAGFFARYETWDPNKDVSKDDSKGWTAGATWRPFEYGRLVADVGKYGHDNNRPLVYTIEYNFMW